MERQKYPAGQTTHSRAALLNDPVGQMRFGRRKAVNFFVKGMNPGNLAAVPL